LSDVALHMSGESSVGSEVGSSGWRGAQDCKAKTNFCDVQYGVR
jgi:hypothetical protein